MLTNDSTPGCGILYIDDEEKALKYFRMAFSEKFKVFTASSGKEGIELLRKEARNIGIVISDQRMPEMLGAEILGIVREEFPSIVRVLTTAYSDLDSAIQAVNKGHIYQYVVKPWEIPDLGMVLQRAADYYQVLSERNQLLALKMTTLQRIVCSDRLKWLLLSSRCWNEVDQSALRLVLSAMIKALPETSKPLLSSSTNLSAQSFEIGDLIRGEYHNAERCLQALDEAQSLTATPEVEAKNFVSALSGKYGVTPDQVGLSVTGSDVRFRLEGDVTPADDVVRALFGILLERETAELSLAFFKALMAAAKAKGSVQITFSSTDSGKDAREFAFHFSPASADEIIDALAHKFSQWDISGR